MQNYERRFEKLPENQKLSKSCSEADLNLVEVGQFFNALPSPNGAKNRSLCRDYTFPRDEKENCAKGWIESDARFGPVSDIKVCKTHGRDSVEVVPSLFEDQTTSWIRIVNGVEKYVREAVPIQEERASGKPAAKARPILKPSQQAMELYSDGTEKKDRHWSEKIQGPLLLPDVKNSWLNYFDTRKLVEKKMPEFLSTTTGRHAVFFTVVNPMDDDQDLRETFCDFLKSKNRPLQQNLETTSRHGKLVQFIARSRRRTAILPNKVQCGRPLWHTACRVHWESDMNEN